MEVIGLTASVMTVAGMAWKSVELLQNVQQGGKARTQLLEEVTTIWLALQRLQQDFEASLSPSSSPSAAAATTKEPWMKPLLTLAEPGGILQQIREELERLMARLTSTTGTSKLNKTAISLRWPFEKEETFHMIQRVSRLKETAIMLMSQSTNEINRHMLGHTMNINAIAVQNYFQQVVKWLSPLNFLQQQREILGSADPYNWVLESSRFKAWHDGDVRSLWCHGAPGAGKSVLAASMFAELMRMHEFENAVVMVAFCSFDNEDSQSPLLIIASLLKQVLQKSGDGRIPAKLKDRYTRSMMSKDGETPDLKSINEILRSELAFFDSAFVILDGLDEVGNTSNRAAIIKAVHSCSSHVKVMISSRHSEDILESLEQALSDEKQVQNSRLATIQYWPLKVDIGKYVSRRLDSEPELSRLVRTDQDLRQSVVAVVVEKSENVFLLARLHTDSLADCLTARELRQAIHRLSPDLEKTYVEALERMKRPLSKARQIALQRLLLWVAWVETPLSVAEMEHALATILPGQDSITADSILPIREMTTWSAGLIFVDGKSLVRVIHPTAGRFFRSHRDALFPDGDTIIAHACIDYLGLPSLQTPISGPDRDSQFTLRIRQHPFLQYVILHSAAHVERTVHRDGNGRLLALLRPKTRILLQALHFIDHHWNIGAEVLATHIASYMGPTHPNANMRAKFTQLGNGLLPVVDTEEEELPNSSTAKIDSGIDETDICGGGVSSGEKTHDVPYREKTPHHGKGVPKHSLTASVALAACIVLLAIIFLRRLWAI